MLINPRRFELSASDSLAQIHVSDRSSPSSDTSSRLSWFLSLVSVDVGGVCLFARSSSFPIYPHTCTLAAAQWSTLHFVSFIKRLRPFPLSCAHTFISCGSVLCNQTEGGALVDVWDDRECGGEKRAGIEAHFLSGYFSAFLYCFSSLCLGILACWRGFSYVWTDVGGSCLMFEEVG